MISHIDMTLTKEQREDLEKIENALKADLILGVLNASNRKRILKIVAEILSEDQPEKDKGIFISEKNLTNLIFWYQSLSRTTEEQAQQQVMSIFYSPKPSEEEVELPVEFDSELGLGREENSIQGKINQLIKYLKAKEL